MSWCLCDQGLYRSYRLCNAHDVPCVACIKLEQEEARLLKAKAALEEQLERCRAARTVVNHSHDRIISRLPQELVSLAFGYCFPPVMQRSSLTSFPADFARQVAGRVLLGSICREWRRMAWSTPWLWTELGISLNNVKDDSWHLEFVRDWLKRSGGLPLSLSVTCLWRKNGDTIRIKALIDEFNHVSDRWDSLEVKDARDVHLPFFKASSSAKPTLRTLTITGDFDSEDERKFSVFENQVKPEVVVLKGLSIQAVNVSWERVTSLSLYGRETIECVDVLGSAPNLQVLALDLSMVPWHTIRSVARPIKHSKVRDLKITEQYYEGFNAVLGSAVFPGLINLTTTNCLAIEPLASFLRRSGCRLKSLAVNASLFAAEELIPLLELTPDITLLELQPEIGAYGMPDVLFQRLAKTAIFPSSENSTDDKRFLPNLRHLIYNAAHLHCSWDRNRFMNWDAIVPVFGPLSELANPRRRPLQTLEMYFKQGGVGHGPYFLEEERIYSFLDVLDAGLDLRMKYIEDGADVLTAAQEILVRREEILRMYPSSPI
ncbi:hypothetical protein CVT26_013184 [Gymnopilus dilepis]|uniref:F-box domain-containing protein n=1 Tax=Gymnopilus dilepis TaxID=231916 RepID=A0A409VWF7_9AGAR|nr:hypothetical protein CVT26_013184 [Gymnopilus dilepis]